MKNFYLPTICLASISPFTEIASADVFVVPGQYPTITQAISAAESAAFIPHTIVVGPGTYTETLIINRPNISLLSTDGSDVTIVDGTNLNYRCIEVKESADNFELDGFTVQNGNANNGSGGGIFIGSANAEVTSCTFRENFARRGAGLGASSDTELTISNCSFVRSTADTSGSGVGLALSISGSESSIQSSKVTEIFGCEFEDNSGGEDIDTHYANIDLQNSTFTHTVTSSRVIVRTAGKSSSAPYAGTTIKNCIFNLPEYWNTYAVQIVVLSGAGSTRVEDCSFINGGLTSECSSSGNINSIQFINCSFENCYTNGIRIFNWSSGTSTVTSVSNCQFTGTTGSAIRSEGSDVSISNCTFSRNTNTSNSQGSAIYIPSGTGPTVGNSFFCENSNPTISGNYESLGGNLFPPTCELAIGACCLSTSCVQLTEAACGEAGGQFAGFGTLCASIECFESDPTGACCINGSAIALKQSECDLVLGEFQGAGSTPDGVTCEPTDSCPQDLNNSGSIDYADLLEVLSAWGPCSG